MEILFCTFVITWHSLQLPEQKDGLFFKEVVTKDGMCQVRDMGQAFDNCKCVIGVKCLTYDICLIV